MLKFILVLFLSCFVFANAETPLDVFMKCAAKGKKGCKPWNKWRQQNPTLEIDLSAAKCPKFILEKYDLSKVVFSKIIDEATHTMQTADLSGANLSTAKLSNPSYRDWETDRKSVV